MSEFQTGLILDVARIAGRELVQRGPSNAEVLIRCPWPDSHTHGDAHASCRLNPSKNTFYCDPCARGGGVTDLAKVLGVDMRTLPTNTAPTTTTTRSRLPLVFDYRAPISADVQAHLGEQLAKSYTSNTWAAFGVTEGRVYPQGLSENAEAAIAFPLPKGGFHVYRYRRSIKKKRWAFANGGRTDLIVVGVDRDDPIILAEGEWDAMRAYELGYAVATGTGAGIFRAEWAKRLANRHVAVTYDIDAAGQAGAEKALKSLGANGFPVTLPLSGNPDGDGKDLSDYVAVYGPDAFHDLVKGARPSAGLAGLLRITQYSDRL